MTRKLPEHKIKYYLPRISDDGLIELMEWAKKSEQTSPELYAWLAEILVGEHERRAEVEGYDDEPRDVELPNAGGFICWSGTQLANALKAITILTYVVSDKSAGEFVDSCMWHVVTTAAVQLKNLDKQRCDFEQQHTN